MPELPEVETLARDLRRLLLGAVFARGDVLWPRSVALPDADEFARDLPGHAILNVGRRGKYLQIALSGPIYLLIHLRMSGQLRVEPATTQPDGHARVVFHLGDGRQLIFSDARKFGRMYLTPDPGQVTGGLGPEPLGEEFTPASFSELLTRRKGALKPLLLNQTFLAGLGNIYTDEALFAAGLHPLRKASSLTPAEAECLYVAIRAVLQRAIGSRGTTLPDARYCDVEGNPGGNQQNLCVYQRCGEPCVRCGTPIERIVVGQRGTHYCPNCQKR